MGQCVLDAVAHLKVCPKTQDPMDFSVTLYDNVPQESGGSGVCLGVYQPRAIRHNKETDRERMPLQTELDDTMHDGEDKVTGGQF